jgi:diguanylate cyclase (GGDEF)-like protein
MIHRLQQWIMRIIAAGRFLDRRDVLVFASSRAAWTTLVAIPLNFLVYELLGHAGLATVPTDPLGDAMVTACVAGPIAFVAYYMVGRAIMDLAISRAEFERLSRHDPLTGLLNRRAFTETLEGLTQPFVLAVIDIDRFKSINDGYGHSVGDRVLVEVAAELRRALGPDAVVARLGGEEFGVAMLDRGRDAAVDALDGARQLLSTHSFDVAGRSVSVTFSAGLSRADHASAYSARLSEADRALYIAKAAGRNRVVHADDMAVLNDSAGLQRAG